MNFKNISVILMSLALILISMSSQAGTIPGIAGVYDTIPGEEFKYDGKTVEVVEFMSFYCHTCYNFESSIPVIRGNFPNKIKWKTVPVYWGEHGSPKPGEAYLLAEETGKGEEMKKALFEAQMVQKRNIGDIGVLESIGKKLGLGSDFSKNLRSGKKAEDIQKGMDMAKAYGLNETPTLIIAGNIKTDSHKLEHNLDAFRQNIIAILRGILKK
ncbi:periplasmic protein disulfide isomerase I [bacterium BMS3Abin10]|nr:periplasmic protein disulfide isomerase I [bacterium BMS3Abin10]GBE39742.1 periplasmic protein disulfide isomerase I [bacterium BMS3Bbin08]